MKKIFTLISCLFLLSCSAKKTDPALRDAEQSLSAYKSSELVNSLAPTELSAFESAFLSYQASGNAEDKHKLRVAEQRLSETLKAYGADMSAEDRFQLEFLREQRKERQAIAP